MSSREGMDARPSGKSQQVSAASAAPPAIVRLATLRLWQEPARFQAYPRFLQDVDPAESYASMADLARRVGGRRMLDDRHVKEESITRNMGDYDSNARGEWIWRGIGLFEKRNSGYVLSDAGRALRCQYRDEPQGTDWKVMLAGLILKREPRTRAIVRALSGVGAELRFRATNWFAGPYNDALLVSELGEYFPLAPAVLGRPNIQALLNALGGWALGEWRSAALADAARSERRTVVFAGFRDATLTVDDLGGALHGPFELFRALGLVAVEGGVARWRSGRAADVLGPELAGDFGWTMEPVALRSLVERLVAELRADDGYLVASALRARLAAAGVADPDRALAELVEAGVLVVESFDYGQRRHGEGLFSDPRKQLVRLRVRGAGEEARA